MAAILWGEAAATGVILDGEYFCYKPETPPCSL